MLGRTAPDENLSGSYDVLAIVDQTHLPGVIKDKSTGVTLGWCVLTSPVCMT
jgi:hypothetical protein